MARLVLRRFARFVVVLLLVTVAAAFLLELVPGEPALVLAGETASPEAIAEINERYGFDQPVLQRYAEWLGSFLQGDLGSSYRTNVPVLDSIRARLPVTLEIALLATLVATCVSVPLGIATGSRAGTRRDRLVGAGGSAVISLPSFLVAILLVYVFAIKLEWFPVTGWSSLGDGLVDNLRSVALPVISVALTEVVILQRVLRSEMIDTLDQPYIAMATAKGMSRRYVLWRHALKPSSFGLLTLSSLSLARLVGGTVIVETVFSLPGIGRLLVTAIQDRDLVVVQGIVAFIAVVYLCINLVVDLLYSVLDPREGRRVMTTETSAADDFAQESTADANVEALEARAPAHRPVTLTLAVIWLVVIFLAAVFADWLPLHSPTEGIADPRIPPFHDWSVPLGTDRLGRDLLSRVIYGARTALAAGLVSTAIALVVGMTIGIVSGYRRGAVDGASGIFTDTLLAVPPLVLLMALAATLQPSMTTLIVGLSIVALPTFIRLARATTLRITAQPYVTAAQAIGTKDRHIMLREIGPGVLQALLAYAMVIAGVLIVVESSLSYLGLGIPPPSPSWGSMIADSQQELQSDPHLVFVPGAVLFITVFALNIVGERSTSRRSGTRA